MADNQSDHGVGNSNTALLQKLASAVNGHAATATFACGGTVPISDPSTGNLGPGVQNQVPPVIIRLDTPGHYERPSKVTFPLPQDDDASSAMLDTLLAQCERATFGMGGRDVLDESYRKASKLDPSAFSTNFHPHDYGIVDSIQQILLPSMISGGQGIGIGPQGVRAELYKLNIYSAPSGKFKSHVDTPRGAMQFGSLVVCLPCEHEGGTLRIKHRGQTVDFTWGNSSPRSIQWAAFYGDCEHEVLEVTSGHRITLTYNLYYSSVGNLARPVSDPNQLPLFGIARDMLLQRTFMRQGGILGFFCHHQYAHSQDSGRKSIPGGFKGVDLAIYSVFHLLGLKVGIHPIIRNRSERYGGLPARKLMRGPTEVRPGDFVEDCLQYLLPQARDRDYNDDEEENTTVVGTHLHGPTFESNYEEESQEPVTESWPHQKVSQIIWMNAPQHRDFAYAGLKYGNEADLAYQFSSAAILVVVPPSSKRLPSHPKRDAPSTASPSTFIPTPASSMSIDNPSNTPPNTTKPTPSPTHPMNDLDSSTTNSTISASSSTHPIHASSIASDLEFRPVVPDGWGAGSGLEWGARSGREWGAGSGLEWGAGSGLEWGARSGLEWGAETGLEWDSVSGRVVQRSDSDVEISDARVTRQYEEWSRTGAGGGGEMGDGMGGFL